MPKTESLRDVGVVGKEVDKGDDVESDGGECLEELLRRLLELVDGLNDGLRSSLPLVVARA